LGRDTGDGNQAQNEMRQRQKEPELVLLAQPDRKSADGKISGANPRPDPPCAARMRKTQRWMKSSRARLDSQDSARTRRLTQIEDFTRDEDTRPKTETRSRPTRKSAGNQIED
jgi:hypothetical protein